MIPPKNILGVILAALGAWLLWRMMQGTATAGTTGATGETSLKDALGGNLSVAGPTIVEAPSALPTALEMVLDRYSQPYKVFLKTGEGSLFYQVEKPFDPYDNKLTNPQGLFRP